VAQDVNARAQRPSHGSVNAVIPDVATTIATPTQRGRNLRQRAVPGRQLGQGGIATVARVDIKDDLARVRPDPDPMFGMGSPVPVSRLDVSAGVVEPMAQQSALPGALAQLRAMAGVRAGQCRGLAAGISGIVANHVHRRERQPFGCFDGDMAKP
jgi:hypothetical protein